MSFQTGKELIKHFEGCKLQSYLCPAGVPTIGYGSTGPEVKMGQTITQAQADALFDVDYAKFEKAVLGMVKVGLTEGQKGALTSFAYNLGQNALKGSTLLKLLNAGDYIGASKEFGKWVNAGGKKLPGLVTRREAERKLFMGED